MQAICEKHGIYESENFEIFGVHVITKCPKCADEEDAETEAQIKAAIARKEKEREESERAALIARGIEPEFFRCKLENYKPETEAEKQALQASLELRNGKVKKVLLLGSNGVGKTMLASALALELGGVRITMFELSAQIRQGYKNDLTELDVLDELLRYPFIAIDELGRTKGSEAELNWLSYLIDKCHVRGIPLMLISNKLMSRSIPQERKSDAFEMSLPNDAISRLRQGSVIVEVKGRDRRST